MALFLRFAVLILPLFMLGCIEKQNEGATTVFKFESWVPILIILVGVGLLVGAVATFRKSWWLGGFLGVAGLLAVGVLGVGMFIDYVKVDAEHFELKTGFWFSPTHHEVKFDQLVAIDITAETRSTRRGKRTSYYLMCKPKAGAPQKVPVGTLMEEAVTMIFDSAEAKGVQINDLTGGQ